jgi:serine/threonine protein kinase
MDDGNSDLSKYALAQFQKQQLGDWTVSQEKGFHGGQACICFLESNDHLTKAVFRCLKPNAQEKERSRFKNELRALSKVTHENVVKPLAHGRDWYVSKRGTPLEQHWHRSLKSKISKQIEQEALEIISGIADGLAACHRESIVHCDIKPANIVMIDNIPVIIDFGLVTDPSLNRITDVGEPKGNRICSHDIARFGDVPLPWTDVFSLAQIFQQMMLAKVNHQALRWQRPIHWQYATYLEGLSDEFCSALRALSASCSIELLCPKDASQFLLLLNNLFSSSLEDGDRQKLMSRENALASFRSGLADRKIRQAQDMETISASSEIASSCFDALVKSTREAKESIPTDFKLSELETPLHVLLSRIDYTNNPSALDNAGEIYQISAKSPDDSSQSYVRICIVPLRPSRSVRRSNDGAPFNMFFLELYFGGKTASGGEISGNGTPASMDFLYLGLSNTGEFWKFSRSFADAERIMTCEEIARLCISKLLDSELWRNLGTHY